MTICMLTFVLLTNTNFTFLFYFSHCLVYLLTQIMYLYIISEKEFYPNQLPLSLDLKEGSIVAKESYLSLNDVELWNICGSKYERMDHLQNFALFICILAKNITMRPIIYCKTHYHRVPFNFTHFALGDDNVYITGADKRLE